MKLSRSYTVEEMDRGAGMNYHPVTRRSRSIQELVYDETKRMFRQLLDIGALMENPGAKAKIDSKDYFPRIGDGNPHEAGDSYPSHWSRDPHTGEKLVDED